uniref:Vacuolar-sorting protein SNF8 n=2 Tax=Guillardia theta TaxID=55529 RepID=A0A7S4HBP0_GUITH|mmetsp:Transcript_13177/g.46196  ORF Transcript_13177/g.46196 Transcript_13177/m.46196 type:complete len:215 (+) Transcript_13177:120-764(+)
MMEKCSVFQSKLEEFARKHKNEIIRNPDFRSKFNSMCAAIGVDPLASNKGFWGALGMGDFYYELGIQMIQVCLERRSQSGGLDSVEEVLSALRARRGPRAQQINAEDLERSVKCLKGLGKSLEIISIKGKGKVIQSVPCELSQDHTAILELASHSGHTSVGDLISLLEWPENRAVSAVNFLLDEGMAWIDKQNDGKWPLIWFPSLFQGLHFSSS